MIINRSLTFPFVDMTWLDSDGKYHILCWVSIFVMVSRLDTDECLNNAVYLLIQQLWEQREMVSMDLCSLTSE